MGIALAAYALNDDDREEILRSLERYAKFVREQLQYPDYRTKSNVNGGKNRGYNYAWVADFYFRMALLTGDAQYARDGYATLQSLYRQFGYGFYCIDYPVTIGLKALEQAGLDFERDMLLQDFKATADIFVKNGLNFPSFEVNYEQSIIAPAVQFLCEVYLSTKEQKYLNAAQGMMPALEALSAQQPNYHQHEIAIRHWDGYWFGKRQTYGDVYPHYWSCITAAAYHYYAKAAIEREQSDACIDFAERKQARQEVTATGIHDYQQRAENIVRGNLSLFREDGRATCAFVFPRCVNGEPAHYADAYANDQDWALLFYMLVNGGIYKGIKLK